MGCFYCAIAPYALTSWHCVGKIPVTSLYFQGRSTYAVFSSNGEGSLVINDAGIP